MEAAGKEHTKEFTKPRQGRNITRKKTDTGHVNSFKRRRIGQKKHRREKWESGSEMEKVRSRTTS